MASVVDSELEQKLHFKKLEAKRNEHFNPFWSVPDLLILLWLTLDNFAQQGETSRTGKG